jgi:hypothetical protein
MVKRKSNADGKLSKRMSAVLRDLVQASGLPLLSKSRVQAFEYVLPDPSILPGPEVAFRHLVHLALLKLDFLDRGERAAERGKPLVPVEALLAGVGEEEVEDDEPDPAGSEPDGSVRRYWAGGFQWGSGSKLDEFVRENYWQIGWPRDDPSAAGRRTWARFEEIEEGDWFAIKGYGASTFFIFIMLGR